MNAFEMDMVLQIRRAEEEGRKIEPCPGIDRPCRKIRGHDGPCYC